MRPVRDQPAVAPALLLFVLLFVLVGSGCASKTERSMPIVGGGVVLLDTSDGPWQPVAEEEEIGGPWRVAHGGFERAAEPSRLAAASTSLAGAPEPVGDAEPRTVPPARPPAAAPRPRGPRLAVPGRRARREVRPVGKKATKDAGTLARDHFLDYPTRIAAARITLHVPAVLAARARLTGGQVDGASGSRQRAVGGARLTLGELTLEADRITLRPRTDGRPDLQVMARGGVELVANVRGNILRESGLRSLLITNDQVVPLR